MSVKKIILFCECLWEKKKELFASDWVNMDDHFGVVTETDFL